MHNVRRGKTKGQKCDAKVKGKEAQIQKFMLEIKRMWNLKCMIILAIIGATGIAAKGLRKNVEDRPGKHSIDSLRKTAVLGTSHTMPKVLQCGT